MSHSIQEALLDRVEECEDVDDLKRIRSVPTRPLSEVLAELKPLRWPGVRPAQTGR
jgi:hypothetical protein